MPEPQLLMVQVTDQYGHVESEPLVVRRDGPVAFLELEDGRSILVPDPDELMAALAPDREARAA